MPDRGGCVRRVVVAKRGLDLLGQRHSGLDLRCLTDDVALVGHPDVPGTGGGVAERHERRAAAEAALLDEQPAWHACARVDPDVLEPDRRSRHRCRRPSSRSIRVPRSNSAYFPRAAPLRSSSPVLRAGFRPGFRRTVPAKRLSAASFRRRLRMRESHRHGRLTHAHAQRRLGLATGSYTRRTLTDDAGRARAAPRAPASPLRPIPRRRIRPARSCAVARSVTSGRDVDEALAARDARACRTEARTSPPSGSRSPSTTG